MALQAEGSTSSMSLKLAAEKAILRSQIKQKLSVLSAAAIMQSSNEVLQQLHECRTFQTARSVSVYLSMTKEIQTRPILEALFARQCRVYIPKIVGPQSEDMRMYPLNSLQQMDGFPLTKWGIPEPSVQQALQADDGTVTGNIDLVIAPGCAFDARCNRLGHGKGYYDAFLERLFADAQRNGRPRPATIGVCLQEQTVETIPVNQFDVQLDYVVTPQQVFTKAAQGSAENT